jgi:hypothetical protein
VGRRHRRRAAAGRRGAAVEGRFEGVGLYGWDTAKKKYAGTWVDPMRSALVVAEGTLEGGTMTWWSELQLPGRTVRWRETVEHPDADTIVFHTVMPGPDGGDFEMMTIHYKRRLA